MFVLQSCDLVILGLYSIIRDYYEEISQMVDVSSYVWLPGEDIHGFGCLSANISI